MSGQGLLFAAVVTVAENDRNLVCLGNDGKHFLYIEDLY